MPTRRFERGFSLVVLGTASVEASLASWPAGPPPAIVYSDPQYTVVRLSRFTSP